MSLFDYFHKFFGDSHVRPPEYKNEENFGFKKPGHSMWSSGLEENDLRSFSSMFDFKMTDPFEMHQFIEQKMNEMMKTFMSPEGFNGFGIFEVPEEHPAVTEKENPRDYYLKPEAKKSLPFSESNEEKSGSISSWLGSDGSTTRSEGKPLQSHTFSSFRSVIRKTVTLPDGTVKTEEIIRNSDGSEERNESHSKTEGNSIPFFYSPFVNPDFPGFFDHPKMPELNDPRNQFLKPGYEKFNPFTEKIDKDLDKQIQQSGVECLPSFTKEPEIIQSNKNIFHKYTKRTVTLPNGVTESEEIICNPDGTEQRTVTHTLPDGTSTVIEPSRGSLTTGQERAKQVEIYKKPEQSFALQGVKDFIDLLFK